jgi:hypothetical protein
VGGCHDTLCPLQRSSDPKLHALVDGLATENAKGELSRKLIALASRRIFWTRNYYKRVELKRPAIEIDYSWNKYLDTVADWSADLITNSNAMTEYYASSDKPAQFDHIHGEFRALEGGLIKLRTTEEQLRGISTPTEEQKKTLADLTLRVKNCIDNVNVDVFIFALNRREDNSTNSASPQANSCDLSEE